MKLRYFLPILLLLAINTPAAAELIPCSRSAERIQISQSSQLDPQCVYTGGVDIISSGVELDCQGASLIDTTGTIRLGIAITAPATLALSDITVKNCHVSSFMNNIRVTRTGFKNLEEGHEYDDAYSNILIKDSVLSSSRGSGLFIDAFVTDVEVDGLEISHAGSVGIYLEAGSKDNFIHHNDIHENGFGHVDPDGSLLYEGPHADLYYVDTGREGIAVDGSRYNEISNNTLWGNSAGGIFLYKNCGEFYTTEPEQWWPRLYGSEGNIISNNLIEDEKVGLWLGSRMSQNQIFMDCSDPVYLEKPFLRIVLDYAHHNTISGNTFVDDGLGIRVEDDYNNIRENMFFSNESSSVAILIGTIFRSRQLNQPVTGTTFWENSAVISGNHRPFLWTVEIDTTLVEGNTSNGRPAQFHHTHYPALDPFLFCDDFWFEPSP